MTEAEFEDFRQLVYAHTHIHCPDAQKASFEKKLRSRLLALHIASFHDYAVYLRQSPEKEAELLRLIDAIAIHESSFFRIPGHFSGLEQRVLPELLHAPQTTEIVIWSAGCSTGEEPYSIAISVLETLARLRPLRSSPPIRILATDISPAVVEKARAGNYPAQKIQKIRQPLLDKYFKYHDDFYQVSQEVKNLVTFEVFNLIHIATPPAPTFALIFCRNLLIYFDRPAQRKLMLHLTHLLADGGFLFLGDAESLHPFPEIADAFDLIVSAGAIIYQKRGVEIP